MAADTAGAWQPQRDVELVAGTPPGGGQDRPARALIGVLTSRHLVDMPIRLSNIPGRGGGNAWDYLARHQGDPHVLAISSPTLISNRLLGVSDLTYRQLTPLATLYTEATVFVVRADSPIDSPAMLLERLGSDAGSVRVALATALGNSNHIALARVVQHTGGDVRALRIAVFDSARYAMAELTEGRADLATITAVSAAPEVQAGTARVLAVSSARRLGGLLSEVPTWAEQQVDCTIGMWRGVLGAPALPEAAVDFWDRAFAAATSSPEWCAELDRQFWADIYQGSRSTVAFLEEDSRVMETALRALGLLGKVA